MPLYIYKAVNPNTRQIIKDEGEFEDIGHLFRYLKSKGLILKSYRRKLLNFSLNRKKVSRRELAELCRNLAFLIRGGVPLLDALQDLAQTTESVILTKGIKKLIRDIESGKSFSDALKNQGKIFAPIIQTLVLVGEESGRLDQTLEAAAEHLLKIDNIVRTTKRALIYPLFLLFMVLLVLVFWLFFVLPKILNLFQEMNIDLPLITKLLLIFIKKLQKSWPFFVISLLIILGIMILFKFTHIGKTFSEKILLRLPLIGRIKRLAILAFFFEYLGLLLEAGLNFINSLEVMEKSLKNPVAQMFINQIKEKLLSGFNFTLACKSTNFFNQLELKMIQVGEETGKLNEQLSYLSDYYYRRLEELVDVLIKLLEPIIIIIFGLFFIIIALALIGPIYELISQLDIYNG